MLLDVVYNHLGPSDLDLWQFDGWSENGKGGIYFYQDDRSSTPWGETRPDFGRPEVRAFLRDNAVQWLDEFRVDGLRWDATSYISSISGGGLPRPRPDRERLAAHGRDQRGAGRAIPGSADDRRGHADRSCRDPAGARQAAPASVPSGTAASSVPCAPHSCPAPTRIGTSGPSPGRSTADPADAFKRVIYTESHDENANGGSRVPEEVWPGYAHSWASKKRATLGSALVMTAPGIPMLFQGQELVEGSWFSDEEGVDWGLRHRHAGLLQLHRDLISLRRNVVDVSRGLRGPNIVVHHVNEWDRILACHRWLEGGPRDDVIVLANFSATTAPGLSGRGSARRPLARPLQLRLGWLRPGIRDGRVGRCRRDARGSRRPEPQPAVGLGPYSAVILSQDE